MKATLISFGYVDDEKPKADAYVDVRGLRNPFSLPNLRKLDGRDAAVVEYVKADPECGPTLRLACATVTDGMRLAIGCHGGKHRSVVMTNLVAEKLAAEGWEVTVEHRKLAQKTPQG